jgi:hypothetical protein
MTEAHMKHADAPRTPLGPSRPARRFALLLRAAVYPLHAEKPSGFSPRAGDLTRAQARSHLPDNSVRFLFRRLPVFPSRVS